jgi:hypothetical protein
MFPLLAACIDARAAYARAQRGESEDEDELRAAALAASDDLIEGVPLAPRRVVLTRRLFLSSSPFAVAFLPLSRLVRL